MKNNLKKKILCTLGPSSLNPKVIRRLSEQQVDLFRLNLSHTPVNKLEEYYELIRSNSNLPICFDTQGAQVRTGNIAGEKLYLKSGTIICLIESPNLCNDQQISLYPTEILKQLKVGDIMSLDFDSVLLQIIDIQSGMKARIISSGSVGANKAVTVMGRTPKIPCLSETDREAIKLGNRLGIQYIALSFANCSEDVLELRSLINDRIVIISKIESWAGISNLNEILDVTDEILIDRGDLSREVVIENIPYMQKEIIKKSNEKNIPVNVATNLLESMLHNMVPTRAEVNDVVNTLNDGADGLVLAAETAVGKHPIVCVSMMRSLIHRFENRIDFQSEEHLVSHSNLVEPHGGELVKNVISDDKISEIGELPRWEVDEFTMMDAKQIGVGSYSPLTGFMSKDNIDSVLENNRLQNGEIWTVPIIFQLREGNPFPYGKAEKVVLCNGEERAIIDIEEVFQYDLKKLSTKYFGTSSPDHPGVARLILGSNTFISGKVSLLKSSLTKLKPYELTPVQSRLIFQHHKWSRIVGFFTDNALPNLIHEYQQFSTMENYDCDGIFIQTTINTSNSDSLGNEFILSLYQDITKNYYPNNKTVIGGFVNYPRYAGFREVAFNALWSKNFGISHIIINNKQERSNDIYNYIDIMKYFERLGDIGIKPIYFKDTYYCMVCKIIVEYCKHNCKHSKRISESDLQILIANNKKIPSWYMRKSVVDKLYKYK